jgi:cytochrome b subunit of formate dehydrogenase
MNQMIARVLGIWCIVAGAAWAGAAEGGCQECHADPELTLRRSGRTVSLFIDSDRLAKSVHHSLDCADCHEGLDPDAVPHAKPIPQVDCFACHDQLGKSHRFHPALQRLEEGGPANLSTDCASCHGSHDTVSPKSPAFAFRPQRQEASCGECHERESERYGRSAHARMLAEASPEAPTCLACHSGTSALKLASEGTDRKQATIELCVSCHRDDPNVSDKTLLGTRFIAAYESSVHAQALAKGNSAAAGCADCHDSHAVDRGIAPEALVNRTRVVETCGACHEEAVRDYRRSVHGVAFQRGNRDTPVCTDCHGEHNILDHTDSRAAVSARNLSAQLCGNCHGSVRLADRYGISPNRFSTFADSYHGLAGRGGAVSVVNCASCHGYHNILRSDREDSPIHSANIALTCGQCHPGANERFAVGRVHVSIDRDSDEPIVYWIASIYFWAIVLIVGGMVLHNGIDFWRHAHRKVSEPHDAILHTAKPKKYPRMSLHERFQHGILALSFIALVITGFMLRYPDAWWVQSIRGLSDNFFELRHWIHRIAGVAMVLAGIWHGLYLATTRPGRRLFWALLPMRKDLTDSLRLVRYNLGLSTVRPQFGRFSYMEKVEYWALIWGSLLMTVTGFVLWFDNVSMGLLTKLGFDIARTIHFYEAILATLAIIVWHFYFVIFNPTVYPMNMAWLTGTMTEEEMHHEHPLELARLQQEAAVGESRAASGDEKESKATAGAKVE